MEYCPYISIIIPTYNRAHLLPLTLDSFLAQDYPRDRYEIIVADNNSVDSTREVIENYRSRDPIMKSILEKRQGVHYARNSAAKIAQGDILYFTDDDMIADRDLLREIIKPFRMDDKVASVTGRVLPRWEQTPPKWILDYCVNGLLSLCDKPEDLIISNHDCGVFSCHQAMRRDVFFKAGGFNPENTAGEWIGDGETGLNIKIKDLGYKFAYIGSSIIYHMIPPSRMTQRYLNKRLANQGNCDSYTEYRRYVFSNFSLGKRILNYSKKAILRGILLCLKLVLYYCGLRFYGTWRLDRAYISYNLNRIKYDCRLMSDEHWRKLVLKDDWLNEQ